MAVYLECIVNRDSVTSGSFAAEIMSIVNLVSFVREIEREREREREIYRERGRERWQLRRSEKKKKRRLRERAVTLLLEKKDYSLPLSLSNNDEGAQWLIR